MSDKNFAITIGGTEMTLDIGKEDLLAVAVANYEQKLLAQKKDLRTSIRKVNEERDEARKSIEEARKALAAGIDRKKADAFVRAAKRVGMSLTIHDGYHMDENEAPNGFVATREFRAIPKDGWNRNSRIAIHRVETVIDDTAEILALTKKAEDANATLVELGEKLAEVTKNLRNMSTKEREARAHLVVKGLQSTEDGRNLLKALTADGNPFMLPDNGEQS
jgi:hypothetical protein